MPNGYLIVRVSAAGGSIPLENAVVTVYNAGEDDSSVIASRLTDSSGRTDAIMLNAPARNLSQSPENGWVRPYAIYNVDVIKNGYYDSFNLEVPVFDGITSVLPIDMKALSEYESDEIRPNIGLVTDDREPPLTGGVS